MFVSKRPRTPHDPSLSRSPSPEPTPKALRVTPLPQDPGIGHPSLCTLPPTCNPPHRPTYLANSKELETHYATYHAHVCEQHGCGCVFPDARLLELHQTECHDPIAALRKDRGGKIFACHLATCTRKFITPKARRLHLIQAHGYPKEYFFAVTNKGVGGLLRKWGEGASMVRGQWKPRDPARDISLDEDESDGQSEGEEERDSECSGALQNMSSDSEIPLVAKDDYEPDSMVDSLVDAIGSLKLVPSKIQFGRGAKRGAFTSTGPSHHRPSFTVVDAKPQQYPERGDHNGHGKGRATASTNSDRWPPSSVSMAESPNGMPEPLNVPRGLRGGHRSGFPRRGRAIGRMVAARQHRSGRGM